ncbi:uncharacterized protein LOC115514555 isoform X1 [Lynx canadensis]|uniref:uncharacterized protein LOC115514555 isoform X1 n=1 Tax=Lynx canadensis TaxID=61383 RepID=UPI0011B0A654|nr:uncharacterized protein LOC115514555 isoform X1 [Lynx canadensis]
MVDWRMANETEKRDGAVYLSECVNGCLRVVSMSSTHGAGLARYPDPKLFIRDQHPESQVSSSREKAEEAGSFFNPQLASEDSAGCISDTEPADVTRMIADSINPNTYKSRCSTADGIVLRERSLIYVIANLSNTVLLNYVWFSCPRACLSDEWGHGHDSHRAAVSCHPVPLWSVSLGLLALPLWPAECDMCNGLRSEEVRGLQGFFTQKTPARGTQGNKNTTGSKRAR